MRNGVVVDIGGSGTRIGAVVDGHVVGVHGAEVATAEDLAAAVLAVDDSPAGVGVSLHGHVDADRGRVVSSRAAAWATRLPMSYPAKIARSYPAASSCASARSAWASELASSPGASRSGTTSS